MKLKDRDVKKRQLLMHWQKLDNLPLLKRSDWKKKLMKRDKQKKPQRKRG